MTEQHGSGDRADLIADLRAAAAAFGRAPTAREMRAYGEWTDGKYVSEFGSWNQALKAAKLPVNRPRNSCARITKSDFETEVRRVAQDIGTTPSTIQFQEHGRLSQNLHRRWWNTWSDMLVDLGLLQPVEAGDD